MPKVTTTNQPKRVKEVSEAEVKNLRRLGILATVDGKPEPGQDAKSEGKRSSSSQAAADEKKKEG